MSGETIDLELRLVAETPMAYGVTEDEPDDPVIWLPKSQCNTVGKLLVGEVGTFEVREWIAIEKGLV